MSGINYYLKFPFRFEIEGGGKAIHTSFVRNNELEFFEFVKGFNNENLK